MEQTTTTSKTLTVKGNTYYVSRFSEQIQQAVEIYNVFQADLGKAQMEVIKTQAALQSVGAQITEGVEAELKAQAESEADPVLESAP